ncbi:hypothetical protein VHEMI07054 [[Torrubiella] hemipterigena]|uniref:Cytochrome P450 n=1 Tax=[Torrubiella] hemipterigena TaxID=1531966 RepID=A0A0A1TKK7_9HYPO|nr:hypothetical protein VHEMI07054 [[Torrubiella] hemipterigena]
MYKEFSGHRRVYIHELHKEFGPVVRLGPNEVSFTSVEALREIYQSGGSGYDKTEFYDLFIQYGIRATFSTLEKQEHDQRKRYIAASYANTNIMHPDVISGIQERVDEFIRQCEAANGQAIDIYDYLHCFAMDCATFHLLHPHGTKSIEGRDIDLMKEYSYGDSLRIKLCRYRWPTLTYWIERIFYSDSASNIGDYVITACSQPDSGDHSLAHTLKNDKVPLNQLEVAAECMNHLAAGIDTTGDALCFLMYQLSLPACRSIQNKLITELMSHANRPPHELRYLDAVVKEGLRCFPPIPMSQPRYVPSSGRMIDGFFIPGRTIVSCQAWSLHQLNPNIFERGDEFIPERWLEPNVSPIMNRLFFSFGAGSRSCTGRHLATAEMKYLLSKLYSRYRTKIAPEMEASMELYDQCISTRPIDQTCLIRFDPI